jgi:hypothetical protein
MPESVLWTGLAGPLPLPLTGVDISADWIIARSRR